MSLALLILLLITTWIRGTANRSLPAQRPYTDMADSMGARPICCDIAEPRNESSRHLTMPTKGLTVAALPTVCTLFCSHVFGTGGERKREITMQKHIRFARRNGFGEDQARAETHC